MQEGKQRVQLTMQTNSSSVAAAIEADSVCDMNITNYDTSNL